jgi:hypothetical protein
VSDYQLDNRLQAYRFFSEHFGLPVIDREIPVDAEIKGAEELTVVLPKDNLTMLGVARRLSHSIPVRDSSPGPDDRARFAELIRYRPVKMLHAWAMATTKSRVVETHSYVFEFDNGLCASGVLVKGINTPADAPVMLMVQDKGKGLAAADVAEYVNRGEQVIAVDLLFTGDNSLGARRVPEYTQLLAAIGDRPLGMKAAQLLAISAWAQQLTGALRKRIYSSGMRSQVASLAAAALEPTASAEVRTANGVRSLRRLIDAPVAYEDAPELFCLDLLKRFDIPVMASLAGPAKVVVMGDSK